MIYSIEHIAQAIKAARHNKGLSQRALSAKIGVPQSHISRIENSAVNLKVSSLIEISRALDMELMLVPRKLTPAVQGLQRSAETSRNALHRYFVSANIQDIEKVRKMAEQFNRNLPQVKEFQKLLSSVKELEEFPANAKQFNQIRDWIKQIQDSFDSIKSLQKSQATFENLKFDNKFTASINQIKDATDKFQNLRNALAHGLNAPRQILIPAYRLGEEEDDA
jgi:transcriptional regulator with XRE-family HTH domain